MEYAELFCQSNFSFLTGASHAEDLVLQANFLRYKAIAITDECSVAGIIRAHTAIKVHQLPIQQIVGSMFWLNEQCQVIVLCPNKLAYSELCRIITNARRRSDKGDYNLSEWDLMSVKHCLLLWLPMKQAEHNHYWGHWLKQHHGNRLWVAVQRHLANGEEAYIRHCESLALQLELPITACGGVLMHVAQQIQLQHTLTAIRETTPIHALGHELVTNTERSLRSKEKIKKLFKPQWIDESISIAQQCQFQLSELSYQYPDELIPAGETPNSYLRKLVEHGKKERFPQGVPSDIALIIEKELRLIEEQNYAFFFLTIHDIVKYAKSQHILYQGRGSAANSIVCYCLEITAVDPQKVSVLFERFISKERDEPPDIDVDFEHERREEIIQYIYRKYGRERAALAATVISYRFKSAVRDVGKALGLQETQLDFFIKNVNRRDKGLPWQSQLTQLGLDPESLKGQQFITLVEQIIGFPRHLSQHVGGFVISSGPLYELVPVENAAMAERTVIQWDKDDLESLGLLKVDILALGMLTAIRKCFHMIKHRTNRDITIADITRLGDDAVVYERLQQADTVGVFQIESRAQMSMLPRLKPKCYYDLVIQIAIVRPGPIQGDMVHPFLKRRDGIEPITYPSEAVRTVLERTMGVPIFQEQVIKLAMVAAGFTGGEADQLRRAMAAWKKNGDVFKFKDKLINGMLNNGYQVEFAEQLFNQICGFGEYGFPESHSASFAVLAYTSAWLKAYYPAEFYASLLNSLPMGFYSASQLIQDAQRHNIIIKPICINQSDYHHCVINEQTLQLGFRMVKGVNQIAAQKIIQNRPAQGYLSPNQIQHIGLNRSELERLASANVFFSIAHNRYDARWKMMENVSDLPLFKHIADSPSQCEEGKSSHRYLPTPRAIDTLIEDVQSTGVSLEHHPITLLEQQGVVGAFTRSKALIHCRHKSMITVCGLVTGRQSPGTAAGVTFITLEDDTGNVNIVVWGATARAQKKAYLTAKILKVKGILEREGNVIHVIAGQLIDLTEHIQELSIRSRDFH